MRKLLAMVFLVASTNACISISTHEEQLRLCRQSADQARQLEQQLAAERKRSEQLAALAAEQQAERDAMATAVTEMRSTYDEIIGQFKDDIERGDLAVRETPKGLVITLDNQILFRSGRAELQPQGRRVLVQVEDVLRDVGGHEIQIQGHTDNKKIAGALKSKFASNWDLSAARAATVLRFLQEKGNIDPSRLVLQAYADQRPIGDNQTQEGRHLNRRVDIVLVPTE